MYNNWLFLTPFLSPLKKKRKKKKDNEETKQGLNIKPLFFKRFSRFSLKPFYTQVTITILFQI